MAETEHTCCHLCLMLLIMNKLRCELTLAIWNHQTITEFMQPQGKFKLPKRINQCLNEILWKSPKKTKTSKARSNFLTQKENVAIIIFQLPSSEHMLKVPEYKILFADQCGGQKHKTLLTSFTSKQHFYLFSKPTSRPLRSETHSFSRHSMNFSLTHETRPDG